LALVGAGRAPADSKKFQRTGERGAVALMLNQIGQLLHVGALKTLDSNGRPDTLVNVEADCTVFSHLQKQILARILICDVDALHHVEDFHGLFAKGG
jgi:hypothetical protein